MKFSILVQEGLGTRVDACRYQHFRTAYVPRRLVLTASGSRHAPIYVAAAQIVSGSPQEGTVSWIKCSPYSCYGCGEGYCVGLCACQPTSRTVEKSIGGKRGASGGKSWLQGLEGLEFGIDPTEFRGEGECERE